MQLANVCDCGISNSPEGPDKLIRQFKYDALNRLLMATGRESDTQSASYLYNDAPVPAAPNAKHTRAYRRNYSYDKIGNVQVLDHKADSNNFLRIFDYNTGYNTVADIKNGQGNLLSDFNYDTNGNTTKAGSNRNMLWDAGDQLKAYYNQTGTTEPTVYAQYLYDSTGSRVKKLVRTQGGGFETVVYIDGIFEYHKKDGEGEKNQLHILDGQSRIASMRVGTAFSDDLPEKQFYVLEDHLGSSCLRLKATAGGTVIDREDTREENARWAFDSKGTRTAHPFGDSSLRTFTKKSYRYVGKEKDAESGLYYYGARYYAAWTCRFVSVDPLAADYPFYTPYNYAGNKPVTKVDLEGLQEEGAEKGPDSKASEKKKGDSSGNSNDANPVNISPLPDDVQSKVDEAIANGNDVSVFQEGDKYHVDIIDDEGNITSYGDPYYGEGKGLTSSPKTAEGFQATKNGKPEERSTPTPYADKVDMEPIPTIHPNFQKQTPELATPSNETSSNKLNTFRKTLDLAIAVKDFVVSKTEFILEVVYKTPAKLGKLTKGLPWAGLVFAGIDAGQDINENGWNWKTQLKAGVGIGLAIVGVAAALVAGAFAGTAIAVAAIVVGTIAAVASLAWAIWDISGGLDKTLNNYETKIAP